VRKGAAERASQAAYGGLQKGGFVFQGGCVFFPSDLGRSYQQPASAVETGHQQAVIPRLASG
jgi:hypothetical protein